MLTQDEIKEFQRTHRNHLWQPLKVDGELGEQTQWAMDLVSLEQERIDLVSIALSYHGQIDEKAGPNEHPLIRKFLQFCGAKPGSPWCAAKMSYVIYTALPTLYFKPTASVHELFAQFEEIHDIALVLPGDGWCWLNPDKTGHTGMVTGVDLVAQTILTSEGNSENGDQVWVRLMSQLRFFRIIPASRVPGIPSKPAVPMKVRGGITR